MKVGFYLENTFEKERVELYLMAEQCVYSVNMFWVSAAFQNRG